MLRKDNGEEVVFSGRTAPIKVKALAGAFLCLKAFEGRNDTTFKEPSDPTSNVEKFLKERISSIRGSRGIVSLCARDRYWMKIFRKTLDS